MLLVMGSSLLFEINGIKRGEKILIGLFLKVSGQDKLRQMYVLCPTEQCLARQASAF